MSLQTADPTHDKGEPLEIRTDPAWGTIEGGLESGREPSHAELLSMVRQAADLGRLPPLSIRRLIAKRIEEFELGGLLEHSAR